MATFIFSYTISKMFLAAGGTASFCFVALIKKEQNKRYRGTRVSWCYENGCFLLLKNIKKSHAKTQSRKAFDLNLRDSASLRENNFYNFSCNSLISSLNLAACMKSNSLAAFSMSFRLSRIFFSISGLLRYSLSGSAAL